jgi:hypothetical protein
MSVAESEIAEMDELEKFYLSVGEKEAAAGVAETIVKLKLLASVPPVAIKVGKEFV